MKKRYLPGSRRRPVPQRLPYVRCSPELPKLYGRFADYAIESLCHRDMDELAYRGH